VEEVTSVVLSGLHLEGVGNAGNLRVNDDDVVVENNSPVATIETSMFLRSERTSNKANYE